MTAEESIAVAVGKIEQKLDDNDRKLDAIHASLKEDLGKVERQTIKTNGRVTATEKAIAMVKGAVAVLTLASPFALFLLNKLTS